MRYRCRIKPTDLLVCLLVVVTLGARDVAAAPILDQQYVPALPSNGLVVSPDQPVAQTFTVGIVGVLESVEVQLARRNPAPAEGITLSIVDATGGIPDYSTVLATALIAPSEISSGFTFVSVDLVAAGISVAVGEQLAIYLTTTAAATGGGINPYAWGGDLPGLYTGGGAYTRFATPFTGRDMGFRTYVEPALLNVPEPASLLLFGMGLAGASLSRGVTRRRRT